MNNYNLPVIGRYALVCISFVGASLLPALGQQYLEEAIPYRNAALIRTMDGFVEANFTRKAYVGRAQAQQIYHSYYRDSIYATQGGYHGYPLHGRYIERYTHKGLKALGSYTYGLRSGKWQQWDEKGMLRKVSRWKKGKETGRFAIYNEHGELQQRGYLHGGKFDGIVWTYQHGDSTSQREQKRYRLGKIAEPDEGSWLLRARDWIRNMF